ncbi:MAG: hypothetical protein OEY34_02895 [Cyclobacteriaceae bacterium]|nr:hypothetical protein [Cyclobacteriaceae bacterium]
MKYPFLLSFMLSMLCYSTGFSQSNEKIYVSQLDTTTLYYGVFLDPRIQATMGDKPVKRYIPGNSYNYGDIVEVSINQGLKKDVMKIPVLIIDFVAGKELVKKLNRTVMDYARKKFGAEQVEAWPEEYIRRSELGVSFDERNIDCKYYILTKLEFRSRLGQAIENEAPFSPQSEGLIVFNVGEQDLRVPSYYLNTLPEMTTNLFYIALKAKEKPGKAGKNIASVSQTNLFTPQNSIEKYDRSKVKEVQGRSDLEYIFELFFINHRHSLIQKADKEMKENIDRSIDNWMIKVDQKL